MDATVLIGGMTAVLGALAGVVKLVLDAQKATEERHIEANARQEERFEKFIGNHMSLNTRAMERVADRLENIERKVDR